MRTEQEIKNEIERLTKFNKEGRWNHKNGQIAFESIIMSLKWVLKGG